LRQPSEAAWAGIREPAENHVIGDGEHRRIRADAERAAELHTSAPVGLLFAHSICEIGCDDALEMKAEFGIELLFELPFAEDAPQPVHDGSTSATAVIEPRRIQERAKNEAGDGGELLEMEAESGIDTLGAIHRVSSRVLPEGLGLAAGRIGRRW